MKRRLSNADLPLSKFQKTEECTIEENTVEGHKIEIPCDCWNLILEYEIENYRDFFSMRAISAPIRNLSFFLSRPSLFTNVVTSKMMYVANGQTKTFRYSCINKDYKNWTKHLIFLCGYIVLNIEEDQYLFMNCILMGKTIGYGQEKEDDNYLIMRHHTGYIDHLYVSGMVLPKSTTRKKTIEQFCATKWPQIIALPNVKHIYLSDCENIHNIVGVLGFFTNAKSLQFITFINSEYFDWPSMNKLKNSVSNSPAVKNMYFVEFGKRTEIIEPPENKTCKHCSLKIRSFHTFSRDSTTDNHKLPNTTETLVGLNVYILWMEKSIEIIEQQLNQPMETSIESAEIEKKKRLEKKDKLLKLIRTFTELNDEE